MVQVSKEGHNRAVASWKNGVLAFLMLGATVYTYDREKPVMSYLEYLPVYRVELRWDRNSLEGMPVQAQASSEPKPDVGDMPLGQ